MNSATIMMLQEVETEFVDDSLAPLFSAAFFKLRMTELLIKGEYLCIE
jgi:hypothetical protein